ncbi:hypothetical protein ACFP3Q_11625 [Nocardioides sp. GCM10027113]|uniref:HNH endonuclease signature motif containing protein n=1 Tax=unclassified Nocardioides TaxID=2615069 RepID=UPI0036093227
MEPVDHHTPTAMFARVRQVRATETAAEAELLQLALAWAHAHPDPDAVWVEDDHADPMIPAIAWDAAAPFAAATGRSTAAGDALIRDALLLAHRLPKVWARVRACEVEAWRARRIAQAVYGQPADVATHLDTALAPIAHTVGPIVLDRLIDEAMLRLHPEDREAAQLEALDSRHATLHEDSINDTGIAEMTIRTDWKDLHDLDQTLAEIAAHLADLDEADQLVPESLDVRRARAAGILADPYAAAALLDRTPTPKRRRKHTTLYVHLSADAIAGHDPVGRCQTTGRPLLEQQIRTWCGRDDTHLTVVPVIDLTDHAAVDAYEIPDRLKTRTSLLTPTCVFPWCTRPAHRCDHDHTIPHAAGGTTCDCNLAPLCRRHHRLKTHAGWTYTTPDQGVWLWAEPHGQQFLRDHTGTHDITPPGRPRPTHNGCRHTPADLPEPVPRE